MAAARDKCEHRYRSCTHAVNSKQWIALGAPHPTRSGKVVWQLFVCRKCFGGRWRKCYPLEDI